MRYVYEAKPDYNPMTHNLYETYQLVGDVFRINYVIQPKPDEDGYTPTIDEQGDKNVADMKAALKLLGISGEEE